MTSVYTWWKNLFRYAQQPTVIDVACSIEVVDEIPSPPNAGRDLENNCK